MPARCFAVLCMTFIKKPIIMYRTYLALLAAVVLAGCSKPEVKEEKK